MNILIDGFYLDKPRGMGRYLQELLFALGRFAPVNYRINVLIPADIDEEQYVLPEKINYIRKRRLPFPLWEQVRMPLAATGQRYDVVHFPYNTMPAVMNLPLLRCLFKARRIVTVHDLMFMTMSGGNFYQGWGNRYRKYFVSLISAINTRIVTVSQESAKQILTTLGVSSAVIYTPVERTCAAHYAPLAMIAHWTGGQRFFLHIGGVSPHKNSVRCIDAFKAAKVDGLNLVVLGLPADCALARSYRDQASVIFPGWVSDEEMRSFLGHTDAVLFPSLMEGYGLPIVEAFAAGKPLLTSNFPPMSELAGDAALLVEPTSVQQLTAGIIKLALDPAGNQHYVQAGHHRMSQITSANMAAKLLAVYSTVT